jgi:lipoprotein-anchoring transpeptidase ErfK/SrfK
MKRHTYEYFMFVAFFACALFLRHELGLYLLDTELAMDSKVNEIINMANNPSDNKLATPIINNQEIAYDLYPLDKLALINNKEDTDVLGDTSDKWIEVNLTQQRLYGWEGSKQVFNYLISSGLWAPTPTGNFNIWIKLASATMQGGSKALGTYYYLPNVPCTMYFYKGYGIHGTYWHNNFGHPMSHGCINMKTPEACSVYGWASVGTKVNIHY